MHSYDQDFRYLLVHLVPQHRLPPDLRRDVGEALRTGEPRDLRRQSIRALESLCEDAYFRRAAVHADNGDVRVAYRRTGGRYQVNVAVPRHEWEDLSGLRAGPLSGAGEAVPAMAPGPRHTAAVVIESPEPGEILPDIIRSFAVADGAASVLERLGILLAALERWLGLEAARLDVIDDALLSGEAAGPHVRVVGDEELRSMESVRAAVEGGAQRLVPKANLAAASPDGLAAWEVMGVAPIFAQGQVIGALRCYFHPGLERRTMEQRLELAAAVVRNVVEFNYQFENLTSIDSLTGIYNRHFFDRQMPVEIERAMRSGSALSMLVLDIDDFKKVNDQLGHKKGDEVLVATAEIVRRNLRKVDLAFRYGGEEMVILLPGTPEFEAVHTAERLRRVIQQFEGFRDHTGRTREITVSVGVAVYPDTAKTGDELFVQADAAMYRAKQRGKNQVVLYSNG
ncbi:MAG TPA: GGDEF domain-containing protein [Candidatus Krumholzibacteria bacterium]|nr:GGDEF domain-containing protein [Candidatus Krumholzibacteria bacterium]